MISQIIIKANDPSHWNNNPFFIWEVKPTKNGIILTATLDKVMSKLNTPIAIIEPENVWVHEYPKNKNIHTALPGVFEYLWLSSKGPLMMSPHMIRHNSAWKPAYLCMILLLAQLFDSPIYEKPMTITTPTMIKLAPRAMKNSILE